MKPISKSHKDHDTHKEETKDISVANIDAKIPNQTLAK